MGGKFAERRQARRGHGNVKTFGRGRYDRREKQGRYEEPSNRCRMERNRGGEAIQPTQVVAVTSAVSSGVPALRSRAVKSHERKSTITRPVEALHRHKQ